MSDSLANEQIPIYVDVDGTLIYTDLLYEATLKLIKKYPLKLFLLPFWLLRGKAFLKNKITQYVEIFPNVLPYHEEFLVFLKEQHQQGRKIFLASASHQKFVEKIAHYLGIFSGILASNESTNLSGIKKLQAILEQEKNGRFAYAGNSKSDLVIWKRAYEVIIVNASKKIEDSFQSQNQSPKIFKGLRPKITTWIKALRIHQWLKNVLLFVPLLTAHVSDKISFAGLVFVAFFCFGFVASATYIINDLFDLDSDRQHPKKCKRPVASGKISIISAGIMSVFLLTLGFLISIFFLPTSFTAMLGIYLVSTLSYSLYFKQRLLLDVIMLAGLYTLRIFAGAMAIQVEVSFWLLAFSMFMFFSLALVKRCSELYLMQENNVASLNGRGYQTSDYAIIQTMGIASGYAAVLVFALYIDSKAVTEYYSHPKVLWLLCPILWYWLNRMWIKTSRGQMHDDPVMFSLSDPVSWCAIFSGAIVFIISYWM